MEINEYFKKDLIKPFPALNDNCLLFLHLLTTLVAYNAKNMDPDQTAPAGAVWSGSILFVSMIKVVWRAFDSIRREHFQDKKLLTG